MRDFMDVFTPETDAEVKDRQKKQQEVAEKMEQTLAQAKKCIGHADFRKYRDDYLKVQGQTIDLLIAYTQKSPDDPIKYAFTVKSVLNRLGNLKYLLDDVSGDARKIKKQVEKVG